MSSELTVWQGLPPSEWDEWVRQADGTIFHSPAWAAYQETLESCKTLYLLCRKSSRDVFTGGVAFLKQSRVPLLNRITRELIFPAHPFVFGSDDKANPEEFFHEVEKAARKMGCCRLILDSFYSGSSVFSPSASGFQEKKRWEFLVDLKRDSDWLWSQIGKDHREKIKKFQKNGFEIVVGETMNDLESLKKLRGSTQEKRAGMGQEYEIPSDDTYYERLYHSLVKQGFARLFLAVRDGEVVSGILFLTHQKKAYSMFSGSTEIGYKFGAQSALFWEAVKSFQLDNFRELNRGGITHEAESSDNPLHGIFLFKKRLGTIPVLCRSGVKIIAPFQDHLADTIKRVRQLSMKES